MRKPLFARLKAASSKNRLALRGGSYSLLLSAVVLAILLAVNVFVSALPASKTKYDISASKLYSITGNTKAVVNALEDDVTVYWIVQTGEEDAVIENLLSKYESLSDHLSVVRKDPDVFPTFADQYTGEEVQNNSLVVECGNRSRYISYDDIYQQEMDPYSYTYNSSFDGEGAITSAIDYVVSEELPQIYLLTGHGEKALPDSFQSQIERENMQANDLSLLTADAIPEDAACVVIYSPASDISSKERDILADYLSQGGKLLIMAGPTEDGILENLYALLSDYGVEANEGIVIETDREHYAFQAPYILLPDMGAHEITDPLTEARYTPILPLSLGLTVTDDAADGTVTELLLSSEASFSKLAGYDLSSYEKEAGDLDGPFALGAAIETAGGGKLVCFASSDFLEEPYNSYSSGANGDLAMNALASLAGEREAAAIRSKSLNYNYLTINDAAASLLKVTMIGVFPLLYLGAGIWMAVKRKGLQNEPV